MIPSSADGNSVAIILIIVFSILALLLLIAAVVIGVILYKKHYTERPKPQPSVRKRKRKVSITDYTRRIISRSSSFDDNSILRKNTTEEVSSGILEDKKDTMVSKGIYSYEPSSKEVDRVIDLFCHEVNCKNKKKLNCSVCICSKQNAYSYPALALKFLHGDKK